MIGRVLITPKSALPDPQGQAIRRSLHALGYVEVTDVRLGKYLEVEVSGLDPEATRQQLDEMCRRLLSNEVIEKYRIELPHPPDPAAGEGE